jgi:hypothetical protein
MTIIMTCDEIRAQLMAYQDGELEVGEREEVARHLADCAVCREELDGICTVLRLAALWEPQEQPLPALQPGHELLTPSEAAVYLRLSETQFAAVLGDLPRIELAGEWRFRRRSLEAWLAAREIPGETDLLPFPRRGRGEVAGPILPAQSETRSVKFALL